MDVTYLFERPSEQAKKASYGGGRGGGDESELSRHGVLRSLEELGVHVDGWEADALLDRFAVEDGNNNVRIASRSGFHELFKQNPVPSIASQHDMRSTADH